MLAHDFSGGAMLIVESYSLSYITHYLSSVVHVNQECFVSVHLMEHNIVEQLVLELFKCRLAI